MLGFGIDFPALAPRRNRPGTAQSFSFTENSLPPGIGLSRPSQGAYIGASGELVLAPSDQPRFDHDPTTLAPRGMLLESDTTNLVLHSSDFTQSPWEAKRVTITGAAALGPDGNLSLDRLTIDNAGGTGNSVSQNVSAMEVGHLYTISAYARRDEHRFAGFWGFGNGNRGVAFDLQSLTCQVNTDWSNPQIQALSPVLARIQAQVQLSSSTILNIGMFTDMGGGKNPVGGEMLSLGFVQVETGSDASSYIPSGGTPGQRAADFATLSNLAGPHAVTVSYDDGSQDIYPHEQLFDGYWPNLSRQRVISLSAQPL